ncbi:BMA-XNP-1, isoform a [Aphelenchoides fujianensis]|nr:BMA-XNP-1, isoform a [Aphelenchoides fujianensis]
MRQSKRLRNKIAAPLDSSAESSEQPERAAEQAERELGPSKRSRLSIKKSTNRSPRIYHRRGKTRACKRCLECGIHLHGPNANDHPNAHTEDPKKSFLCAICGIFMQKPSGRNVHEQNQHGFIRDEAEKDSKAVVKIRTFQLSELFNVGTELVEVQRKAEPSSDPYDDEYANEDDLQAIVDADPQGGSCPNEKNGARKSKHRELVKKRQSRETAERLRDEAVHSEVETKGSKTNEANKLRADLLPVHATRMNEETETAAPIAEVAAHQEAADAWLQRRQKLDGALMAVGNRTAAFQQLQTPQHLEEATAEVERVRSLLAVETAWLNEAPLPADQRADALVQLQAEQARLEQHQQDLVSVHFRRQQEMAHKLDGLRDLVKIAFSRDEPRSKRAQLELIREGLAPLSTKEAARLRVEVEAAIEDTKREERVRRLDEDVRCADALEPSEARDTLAAKRLCDGATHSETQVEDVIRMEVDESQADPLLTAQLGDLDAQPEAVRAFQTTSADTRATHENVSSDIPQMSARPLEEVVDDQRRLIPLCSDPQNTPFVRDRSVLAFLPEMDDRLNHQEATALLGTRKREIRPPEDEGMDVSEPMEAVHDTITISISPPKQREAEQVAAPDAEISVDANELQSEQSDALKDAEKKEESDNDDGPFKRVWSSTAPRIESDGEEAKEPVEKTGSQNTVHYESELTVGEQEQEQEAGLQAAGKDGTEDPEFNLQELNLSSFNSFVDDENEGRERSASLHRATTRADPLGKKASKRALYEETDEEAITLSSDDDDEIVTTHFSDDGEYKPTKDLRGPGSRLGKRCSATIRLDSDHHESVEEGEEEEAAHDEFQAAKKNKQKLPTTLQAEREKRARLKRPADEERIFNEIVTAEGAFDPSTSSTQRVEQGQSGRRVLLDDDSKSNSPRPVEVHPSIARKLKPHQTIAYLHTILTHETISKTIRRVLIFVPKNVVLNWANEFEQWLHKNDRSLDTIRVFEMGTVTENAKRLELLKAWKTCEQSSCLIMGYELFRRLTCDMTKPNAQGKFRKLKNADKELMELQPQYREYLQNPGADLVVLDEGHMLKNPKSALTQCMGEIATLRRIVLSGTPMQNNLIEYYTMISFVRPNLLGSAEDFDEKFKKPIEKGRTKDAEAHDVKKMKRTAHVLYKCLNNVLDRKDYSALTEAIPPKQEYVISCYCSKVQLRLYDYFINQIVNRMNPKQRRLFVVQAAHIINRFTSHVYNLIENEKRKAAEKTRKALKNFVVDEEEVEDEAMDDEEAGLAAPIAEITVPSPQPDWFRVVNVVSEADKNKYESSAKLTVVAQILKECEKVGDKVLIFGQSLENLRLIQRMLEFMQKTWFDDHTATANVRGEPWGWKRGRDFAMIDGSVGIEERQQIQRQFNDIENPRTRLCLISTKAGALGTNFVGANRVIVFDLSWNPTHDQQALFRAYRLGQWKPVFVYRLVSLGLESRVTKTSTAQRVLDGHAIKRHYTNEDLEKMLSVPDEVYTENAPKLYGPPEDELLACVFHKCPWAIHNCWQHDSLLLNDDSEQLSPEECDAAWAEFEKLSSRNAFRDVGPAQGRFVQSCKNFAESIRHKLTHEQKNSLLVDQLLKAGCNSTEALALGCVFNFLFTSIHDRLPDAALKDAYNELRDPHDLIVEMTRVVETDDVGVGACFEAQKKLRDLHRQLRQTSNELKRFFDIIEAKLPGTLYDDAPAAPQSRYTSAKPQLATITGSDLRCVPLDFVV